MKKKLIVIMIICLLLLLGATFFIYINKKDSIKKYNPVTVKDITLKEDAISISCSENGNFIDRVIRSENVPKINPGIKIKCMFTFTNNTENDILVKKIDLDYEINGDIENFEISRLNFDYKENNNHIELSNKNGINTEKKLISSNDNIMLSGTPFLEFNFNVKGIPSSSSVSFKLKKIIISNDKERYFVNDFQSSYDVEKNTPYIYKINDKYSEITFYKDNDGYKEINKYTCQNECHEYAAQCFSYVDLINGKMFIIDGDNAILYDMNKGVLGEYIHPLYNVFDTTDNSYTPKYFIGKKVKNGKYGIIDFNGNIIKDYTVDEFGVKRTCDINPETYSIKYNLISVKNNNKYGISKITTNDLVSDYQFDDIRIYNDKYYKAKLNNKWYLYNISTNEKLLDDGYDQIFMPRDNILIVQNDGYLYIKDYNGNNLIDENIKVLSEYNENACCGATLGIYIYNDDKEKNIINISVDNGKAWNDDFEQIKYIYDIENNTLTKKDSQ